ncbi:MAG: hypothetical protein HY885_01870 [Deltaproteobacteria bacterium]|nr:hypothetical protein [Deltaproteobacteria bacterium]
MAILINRLESEIDNTLEMSAICRGEWCRALESKVDDLRGELSEASRMEAMSDSPRVVKMSEKIRKAYRNLGPDIHV